MNPTNPLDICRLYLDHKDMILGTLRFRFGSSPLSDQDLEDIVQDLFVQLQKRGTQIIGRHTLNSLITYAVQDVLDFLRRRESGKRGGKILSSLDKALEDGFDSPAPDMTPQSEALEIADLVIAAATPTLSARQLILLRYIRETAPFSEMSLSDLVDRLTPSERRRFLPVHRSLSARDEDIFILRQVSRSRSSLWSRLRALRDAMVSLET